MKIGTYQMDTSFGLYLPEYTIPAPTPQTNYVQIIGRDGSVDLSEAIGLHYDSRVWDLDFKCFDPTVNWHTLTSQVMNAIHGKRLNFEFDDDPNYFWTGRVSVSSFVSNHGTGTLKINITSDPFKYAKLSTIVTKNASTGTDYTGALVSFNTANAKINDLSVTMQPIQSLNGYANPWPGGGGVNLFDPDNLDAVTVVGNDRWGHQYTNPGTYALKSYSAGSSGYLYARVQNADSTWQSINYVVSGNSSTPAIVTITAGQTLFVYDAFAHTKDVSSELFNERKVQVALSSTQPEQYYPYENICPISGRTGLNVYVSPTQDPDDATAYNVDWSTQAGTVYGGTLDVVTGVLTVTHGIVDAATLTWTQQSGGANGRYFASASAVPFKGWLDDGGYSTAACNALQPAGSNASSSNAPANSFWWNNAATGWRCIYGATTTTLTEFTSFLSSNSVVFYGELATPLTYQLTPQELATLTGQNNVWSDSGDVFVTVVTPETVTNNGRAVVPTLTASADMVLKWGNYSASVQQGTSTVPQLILENGANLIYIIGTGTLSFTWQEASL
jgi:hypothetical protein